MKLAGLTKLTLNDFPGRIGAVVYTPGCNFRCPFCHNADLVLVNKKTPFLDEAEFWSWLKRRQGLLDGLVVSGGEPCLQPDLVEFLTKVHHLGFETMIETNSSRPEVIKTLVQKKLVDYWATDYKTSLGQYDRLVGLKGAREKLLVSYQLLLNQPDRLVFRTTLVPEIHTPLLVEQMVTDLVGLVRRLKVGKDKVSWDFQCFRPGHCFEPSFNQKKEFDRQKAEKLVGLVQAKFPRAKLRL